MSPTFGWFIAIGALTMLALCAGLRIGQRGCASTRVGMLVAFAVICGWAWLMHHPSAAVLVLPVSLLCTLEGVGAVPPFMLIIGIAIARSHQPRQKRLAALAMLFGMVYFITGGMWMVMPTPQGVFAHQVPQGDAIQSQEYSCVPAACATALTRLGVPTSENQMAQLTATRPGTGSTLLRALDGLRKRLDHVGSPIQAHILTASYDDLIRLPTPMITNMRYASTMHHMVTILDVRDDIIILSDPELGRMVLMREYFEHFYSRHVIAFDQ